MKFDSPPSKMVMPLSSFDPSLLPEGRQDPSSPDYSLAIHEYLTQQFKDFGVQARIVVGPEAIEIDWSGDVDVVAASIRLLEQGDYADAVVLLRGLLSEQPDNVHILYNLGMALSDMGQLDEAVEHLEHLDAVAPEHVNGLVALGVAYARQNELAKSSETLAKACEAEPENAVARRNYGGILMKQDKPEAALEQLQAAAELNPDDPGAWYGVGQANLALDNKTEADQAFRKVIDLAAGTEIAEAAKREMTQMAESRLRQAGERPDAVQYCLGALEHFSKLSDQELKPIMLELAVAGEKGYDINNPDKKHHFDSIEGEFTGLQAVCYMYVAAQRLIPGQNLGIDLADEYRKAKSLYSE